MFCKTDINSDFGKRIIRVANLTQANAEKNEPTSIIFDFVKGFNKWRFEDFFKEIPSRWRMPVRWWRPGRGGAAAPWAG